MGDRREIQWQGRTSKTGDSELPDTSKWRTQYQCEVESRKWGRMWDSNPFESSNAYQLMSTWITFYNTAVHLQRTPQTKLQKHVKQASITFKAIYNKANLLRVGKETLIVRHT